MLVWKYGPKCRVYVGLYRECAEFSVPLLWLNEARLHSV